MKDFKTLLLIGCLVCLSGSLASKAKAGELDQKTMLIFYQQSVGDQASNESDAWGGGLAKTDRSEFASANKRSDNQDIDYMWLVHQRQAEELKKSNSGQSAMPTQLPRTGSRLPLVFLSGFFLVAVSFGLRFYSKRID
jgi:hypothetical protein